MEPTDQEKLEGIATLAKNLADIKIKKEQLKGLRADFKQDCMTHSGYRSISEDLESARGRMKILRDEVADNTGAGSEIKDMVQDIKMMQTFVDSIAESLLKCGAIQSGEEIEIEGGHRVIPTFSVRFVQQKLDF